MKVLIHGSTPTRFTGGHHERGSWWFRIYGYGIHYTNTRRHPLLFSARNRLGWHRFDRQIGPFVIGILGP